MAGSVAVGVGDVASRLVDNLVTKASKMKVGRTDEGADVDMGPVISREHMHKIEGYLDIATREGAALALDGRKARGSAGGAAGDGFLLGPSVIDKVDPGMRVAKEEIFGPVLSVIRAKTLDEALAIGKKCEYGNGASIFTNDGYAARMFKHHFNAGMIGINIGVPAPMAWFPFTGWNKSFFGDLHIQGTEAIQFYTQQKMTMTRWFESAAESHHDPVWKQK
jgi:malonate-semialdehyde dehydrogenase (acetylating)/methylmalonate-semialdehyde dehydrogenase